LSKNRNVIDLGLVQVTPKEAADCVKMLMNDAKQIAGEFHGQNRSEKFRNNWPDEYKFASANWKSFVEPMLIKYAELLGDPKVSETDKHRIYVARLMWEKLGEGKERDNRLQIMPNSQQFVGDAFENRKIKDNFGTHRNLRAALLNTVATRH
jgi:hypothetical protein